MLEVRHLTLLRELRDAGSVAAAATALHVTPSAVSQQLRSAEKEVGHRLVVPDGRGVRLTEEAQMLAEHAVEVTAALERAQAAVHGLRAGLTGTVTIAALPSIAEYLLPSVLKDLSGSGIDLQVTDRDVSAQDFVGLADAYDLVLGHAVGPGRPARAGLAMWNLLDEPLDVAVPRSGRWGRRVSVRAAEVSGEPWIVPPLGFPFRTVLQRLEVAAGVQVRVVQEVLDNRLVEAMVAAGNGVALLPRFTTGPGAGVRLLAVRDVVAARQVWLMARRDRAERAAVRLVVDAVRAAAAARDTSAMARQETPG
ncbi:LysR family transcriptional regulator [Dermacoccaceae bacterium W4C1]